MTGDWQTRVTTVAAIAVDDYVKSLDDTIEVVGVWECRNPRHHVVVERRRP